MWKAKQSFKIALAQRDVTNAVRQIERANLALIQEPSGTNNYKPYLWRQNLVYSCNFSLSNYVAASNYIINLYPFESYEIDCIREALNGKENGKENLELVDMLLHAWPLMENVDDIILTNRTLSNNVFEQKRKNID